MNRANLQRQGIHLVVKCQTMTPLLSNTNSRLLLLTLFVTLVCVTESSAEPKRDCLGFLARSKRNEVPVYPEPDVTQKVKRRLTQGEVVCVVGEVGEFLILDSPKAQSQEKPPSQASVGQFVRKTDLWESEENSYGYKLSPIEKIKQYVKYLQSGGVPDDGLYIFRPLIDLLKTDDASPEPHDAAPSLEPHHPPLAPPESPKSRD